MEAARHRVTAGTVALAIIAGVAAMAPAARANGAFPDEFSVHLPAGAPHRIFLGTNFGLVVSEDDGATWRYACEPYIVGLRAARSGRNGTALGMAKNEL